MLIAPLLKRYGFGDASVDPYLHYMYLPTLTSDYLLYKPPGHRCRSKLHIWKFILLIFIVGFRVPGEGFYFLQQVLDDNCVSLIYNAGGRVGWSECPGGPAWLQCYIPAIRGWLPEHKVWRRFTTRFVAGLAGHSADDCFPYFCTYIIKRNISHLGQMDFFP